MAEMDLEQYILKELTEVKAENKELKQQLSELEEAQKKTEDEETDSSERAISLPSLGVLYSIDARSWNIKEENIDRYKKALREKDFEWLVENGYEVSSHIWNYEIKIGKLSLKLNIYSYDGDDSNRLKCYSVNDRSARDLFDTQEQAQEALLKALKEDIREEEKELELKAKKEKENNIQ